MELRQLLRAVIGRSGIDVRVGSGFAYLLEDAPPCTAAVEELVVAANGRIYPCSGFAAYHGEGAIGNAAERSLGEVWRDAPYLRAVREALAARLVTHRRCDAGCLAQKAAASGRLTDAVADPDAVLIRVSAAL
jgi:radical SAM protein with 4Fe4S-binding SPASM domain